MTPADEELLDFVSTGLKVFGPEVRFTLYAHGHRLSFVFPPDRAWRAPVFKPKPVQTSAHASPQGHQREILFRRKR